MLLSIAAFAAGIAFGYYFPIILTWFSKEEPVVAAAVQKIVVTKAPAPPVPPAK